MSTSGSGRMSDDELFIVLLTAAAVLAVSGAALVATGWAEVVRWLVKHAILLSAARHPWLRLPAAHGAGLDLPRLAILGAAVLAVAAGLTAAIRAHMQGDQ